MFHFSREGPPNTRAETEQGCCLHPIPTPTQPACHATPSLACLNDRTHPPSFEGLTLTDQHRCPAGELGVLTRAVWLRLENSLKCVLAASMNVCRTVSVQRGKKQTSVTCQQESNASRPRAERSRPVPPLQIYRPWEKERMVPSPGETQDPWSPPTLSRCPPFPVLPGGWDPSRVSMRLSLTQLHGGQV